MAQAGYQGINELQAAEQEATKIISEAREMRQKLTEQSHIEAKKQIESYRKKLDNEFKAKEQAKLGDSQQQEIKQLEEKTNKEIDTMKESYNANKNQVVDLLINAIVNVDTTVPEKRKHHF